jgi:hypothetical protein
MSGTRQRSDGFSRSFCVVEDAVKALPSVEAQVRLTTGRARSALLRGA